MAKTRTRRKGFTDVTELDAMSKLYDKGVTRNDWRMTVVFPAVLYGGLVYAMTHNILFAGALAAYGAYFGKAKLMTGSLTRKYENRSLQERNRFLNALTQVLTDHNKITLTAIEIAQKRTTGELENDLSLLQAQLEGADRIQVGDAFDAINRKYERDILFVQYMEQLEIALLEGREGDIESMKQIKTYHNQLVRDTKLFFNVKEGHFILTQMVIGFVLIIVVAVNFAFSAERFKAAFANNSIGLVTTVIYMAIFIMIHRSFYSKYYDDDITSVGKYKTEKEDKESEETEVEEPLSAFLVATKQFWLSLVGEKNYEKFIEMNHTETFIVRWQSTHFIISVFFAVLGLTAWFFIGEQWILYGSFIVPFGYFFMQKFNVSGFHTQYKFDRQMEFMKFSRALIPHLKLKRSGGNLYQIFEKILPRFHDETGRTLLMRLMTDMTENSDDPEPFITFAEKMSNSDRSILFMNTIFDARKSGVDLSVIEELERTMSEDMIDTIAQIKHMKEEKLAMYGAYFAFSVIIVVGGVLVAFLIYEFTSLM